MKVLRIGVLLDDFAVPAWVAATIGAVIDAPAVEIVTVVINRSADQQGRLARHHPRSKPFLLARLYLSLDRRLFHPSIDPLTSVDVRTRFDESLVIEADPLWEGAYFSFSEPITRRLADHELDVLLLFGFGLPARQVLELPRHGVWCFLDHQLMATGRSPVGFWEVLRQDPITVQCLQAYVATSKAPVILHRHLGPTHHRSISLSRENLLWTSAPFVARQLDELQRSGAVAADHDGEGCEGSGRDARPSNLTLLKNVSSHALRFLRDQVRQARYLDQWVMAFKYTSEQCLDRAFGDYHWLIPPTDRVWADPFPVRTTDGDFLFFEEVLLKNHRGHLCVAPIDANGFRAAPMVVLECDYHLSYPFVFTWQGNRYLMPETQEANRIDIYEFESFPGKVRYCRTIMENVRAVDATLFEAHGHWWMFVGIAPPHALNTGELSLFYADGPFGPWTAHPRNPIRSDVRAARPAGQVFTREGRYYRPAQDCSHGYGYAIRVHEITILSTTDYKEEEVEAILPDWSTDIVAIHTLNCDSGITVIDAKKRRRW